MARILLIEDDEPLRKTLGRLFLRSGYEVAEAENGRTALQEMARQPADLVITDLIMPEVEGVETIRSLRRQYPGIKIIAMSGGGRSSAEGYLRIAQNLGAQRVLAKPLTPWELLEAIRELLDAK
jgi:CheY-like chemotaxis protein